MPKTMEILDGNEAAASVAYRLNEVIAIYPITPSSPMGELADQWKDEGRKNILGAVPHSRRNAKRRRRRWRASRRAAGRSAGNHVHRIAGPAVDDSQYVQDRGRTHCCRDSRCRSHGSHARAIDLWRSQRRDGRPRHRLRAALLPSVQEAPDFALIAQAATLESRIPFLHFFDGFRTSHEMNKIQLSDDDLRALIDRGRIRPHRERALRPGPSGPARNRPESRRFLPGARGMQPLLPRLPYDCARRDGPLCATTGRSYHLFDYVGPPTPSG